LGKRKVLSEEQLKELVLPGDGEQFGRVIKRLGSELMQVRCADGKIRLGRIRGKLKKRVWVRDNDLVLVAPWEFKTDQRCDILWRYTLGQVEWLIENDHLVKGF
jgi:translation initiation factor 1A